jgi:hypothetical protein
VAIATNRILNDTGRVREDPAASVGSDPSKAALHRSVAGLISLWSAFAAFLFLLAFLQLRGRILLFAVPAAGLNATLFGVLGLIRARKHGASRVEALIGCSVGVGILVLTAAVGWLVWEISKSNWQF